MPDDEQRSKFYGNVTIEGQNNVVQLGDSTTIHYNLTAPSVPLPPETLELIIEAARKINIHNVEQSARDAVARIDLRQLDFSGRTGGSLHNKFPPSSLDYLIDHDQEVKTPARNQRTDLHSDTRSWLRLTGRACTSNTPIASKTSEQLAVIKEHLCLAAVILLWVAHRNVALLDIIDFLTRHGFHKAGPGLLLVILIGIYRYQKANTFTQLPDAPFLHMEDAYGFSRSVSVDVFSDYAICQQFLRVYYRNSARLMGWRCIGSGQFHLRLKSHPSARFGEPNWPFFVKCLTPGMRIVNTIYMTSSNMRCLICKSPLNGNLDQCCSVCGQVHQNHWNFEAQRSNSLWIGAVSSDISLTQAQSSLKMKAASGGFAISPSSLVKFPPPNITSSKNYIRNIKHLTFGFIPLTPGTTNPLASRIKHLTNDTKLAHDEIIVYLRYQSDTSTVRTRDFHEAERTVPAFYDLASTLRQIYHIFTASNPTTQDSYGPDITTVLNSIAQLLQWMWWVMGPCIENFGREHGGGFQAGSWRTHGGAIREAASKCNFDMQVLGQAMLSGTSRSDTETSSRDSSPSSGVM